MGVQINTWLVFGFRSCCVLDSMLACQVDGEHGFFCFMRMCVCVHMSGSIRMDGSHPGILCTSPNLWISCTLCLTRPASWSGHICNTHTGLPSCLLLMWAGDEPCCSLLPKTLLLCTGQYSCIICTAAYHRYDNAARCPGRFKQTSDEFHPLWTAKHGGDIII